MQLQPLYVPRRVPRILFVIGPLVAAVVRLSAVRLSAVIDATGLEPTLPETPKACTKNQPVSRFGRDRDHSKRLVELYNRIEAFFEIIIC